MTVKPTRKEKKKNKITIVERVCFNCFYFSTEYYNEEYEVSVCVNYRSNKYNMEVRSVDKCEFFKYMPIIAGR